MKAKSARILILCALLVVAMAISLPGLIPERNHKSLNSCQNQLLALDNDVKEWAKQIGASNGTPVTLKTLESFDPKLRRFVDGCPDGGTYTLIVGQPSKCSKAGLKPNLTKLAAGCRNNLRMIDSAKQQWAEENRTIAGSRSPTLEDIRPYLGRGVQGTMPSCPTGGTYSVGRLNDPAQCSLKEEDHR